MSNKRVLTRYGMFRLYSVGGRPIVRVVCGLDKALHSTVTTCVDDKSMHGAPDSDSDTLYLAHWPFKTRHFTEAGS